MSHSQSISEQDAITQLWLSALLESDATLPRPVADAMVHNVARGPVGETLLRLEQALMHLESLNLDDLAGSEARTILAVLIAMDRRVNALQFKIRQLWNPPA
ncbi:MAG: hypothetical protein HZB51_22685 [Chloroflexi bacterium]|nr:hypothetical protein [Chloroflexota bacterium]